MNEETAQELLIRFCKVKKRFRKNKHNEDIREEFLTIEQNCLDSFRYIVDMYADKYKQFSNYEDIIQEGYVALIYAINSYNPRKGISELKKHAKQYYKKQANNVSLIKLTKQIRAFNITTGYRNVHPFCRKASIKTLINTNFDQYINILKSFNFYNQKGNHREFLGSLIFSSRGSWFWWAHRYIDTRIARTANAHSVIRFPMSYTKTFLPKKEAITEANQTPVEPKPLDIIQEVETSTQINKTIGELPEIQKKIISLYFGFEHDEPKSTKAICRILNIGYEEFDKNFAQACGSLKISLHDHNKDNQ